VLVIVTSAGGLTLWLVLLIMKGKKCLVVPVLQYWQQLNSYAGVLRRKDPATPWQSEV
jgi:hypothetical protein